jgi:NADPH:quinone reductase-like Zn-dependent oxidoreductase
MREAGRLFEAGKMRSVIDRVYPLEELASAHEHSESGRVSGKIVVDIGGTG